MHVVSFNVVFRLTQLFSPTLVLHSLLATRVVLNVRQRFHSVLEPGLGCQRYKHVVQ